MNEQEAINLCKELWSGIHKSKKSKNAYIDTHKQYKHLYNHCPLCDYVEQGGDTISKRTSSVYNTEHGILWCISARRVCPLIKKYNKNCYILGFNPGGVKRGWFKSIENLK